MKKGGIAGTIMTLPNNPARMERNQYASGYGLELFIMA